MFQESSTTLLPWFSHGLFSNKKLVLISKLGFKNISLSLLTLPKQKAMILLIVTAPMYIFCALYQERHTFHVYKRGIYMFMGAGRKVIFQICCTLSGIFIDSNGDTKAMYNMPERLIKTAYLAPTKLCKIFFNNCSLVFEQKIFPNYRPHEKKENKINIIGQLALEYSRKKTIESSAHVSSY